MGCECSEADTTLFLLKRNGNLVFQNVYVDNIVLIGNYQPEIDGTLLEKV